MPISTSTWRSFGKRLSTIFHHFSLPWKKFFGKALRTRAKKTPGSVRSHLRVRGGNRLSLRVRPSPRPEHSDRIAESRSPDKSTGLPPTESPRCESLRPTAPDSHRSRCEDGNRWDRGGRGNGGKAHWPG